MSDLVLDEPPMQSGYYEYGRVYKLGEKGIFVFGSNLKGVHGAGAAKAAYRKHGAIFGVGEGMQGTSYALPTKDKQLTPLTLESIKKHVDAFKWSVEMQYEEHKHWFYVTPIGTGLAGFRDEDIAPMFKGTPYCWFPDKWKKYLGKYPAHTSSEHNKQESTSCQPIPSMTK